MASRTLQPKAYTLIFSHGTLHGELGPIRNWKITLELWNYTIAFLFENVLSLRSEWGTALRFESWSDPVDVCSGKNIVRKNSR